MPGKMMKFGLLLLLTALPFLKATAKDAIEDLSLSYGDEEFVSIATGQKQHISKAPAVASVITKDEILAIGATDLDQVLETIPGLHVSVSSGSYNPIYIIRGIHSDFNPQVLILINGIPINNAFLGDRSQSWGGMSVENIERIEVIRGPGSAIYGADAFAGAINIITKEHEDFDGTEIGLRAGSFDTYDGWFLHSGTAMGWGLSLGLELHTTNGQKGIITEDFQSQFDSIFGTSASLAPDSVNTGADAVEFRLDLSKELWRVRMGYQGRRNVETGAGIAQALDPAGYSDADRSNFDLTYDNKDFSENWSMKAQVSYFESKFDAKDLRLFPPGAVLPIGDDGNVGTPGGGIVLFPDGLQGNPDISEEHVRFGVDMFYFGFNDHAIRLGSGVSHVEIQPHETKNFGPGVIDGTEGVVNGDLTDVTGTDFIFINSEDRNVHYAFFQDEWSLAADWQLTTGIRFDDYSDFGSTTNPRVAIIWQTLYNLTTKLLYGQAFRAPSFAEQFNINNPVALGNPNLDPEEIDTIEVAFDYVSGDGRIRTNLNIFHYEMTDIIRFVPNASLSAGLIAQNVGEQTGDGLEWEMRWHLADRFRLYMNYAYQHSEDRATNTDVAYVPGWQFYLRADWEFNDRMTLYPQINYVADRKRALNDPRPPLDDYVSVDMNFRYKPSRKDYELALIIKNLLDEDIREPSLTPGLIPNDLPRAGRAVTLEYRQAW